MITLKRPLRPLLGMLAVAAGAAAVWCGVCLHETPPHLAISLSAQPHEALLAARPTGAGGATQTEEPVRQVGAEMSGLFMDTKCVYLYHYFSPSQSEQARLGLWG